MKNASPLYALTALFDTPDGIIRAAEGVAAAGYTRFDVNTPYPVHGMDHAMRLRTSRLGIFALIFGLAGAVGTILFITWATLVDYPMVIGGKPFWSWPAFVPVTFEVTVLLASVLTVVTMIVLYFKFPNTSHPLHDTPYMKMVSSDHFGIAILASDPIFDDRALRSLLEELGAKEIAAVRYDLEDRTIDRRLFEPRFIGILAVTAILVSGATYVSFNHLLFWTPYNWMMDTTEAEAAEAKRALRERDWHAAARSGYCQSRPATLCLRRTSRGSREVPGQHAPADGFCPGSGKEKIPHLLQPLSWEFREGRQPPARPISQPSHAAFRQGPNLARREHLPCDHGGAECHALLCFPDLGG